MKYSPVEIIAFVFILLSIVKIIFIVVHPKLWNKKVVTRFFYRPHAMSFISLVLAGIVLYYLLQELSIVQILASATFVGLLITFGLAHYAEEIKKFSNKISRDREIIKKSLVYIILWLVLLLWGLKEIIIN